MRNALATLVLAAVPALLLTACNGPSNGSSGVSALPNARSQARLHPQGINPKDMYSGGATFPAYAYNLGNQPVGLATQPQAPPGDGSLFASANVPGGGAIYYCLTGSGTGRGIFETGTKSQSGGSTATTTGPCAPLGATPTGFGANVDPPDFAGSDVAMASTEYPTYKADREPGSGTSWGEPVEFPVIGGPIVYGYRPQDFKKLTSPIQLSRWTYCAIANGTVSNWNDPAITADNDGKSVSKGVSEPITFFFRSDGSGTSYNYTYHLASVCTTGWPKPYNAAPYQSASRSAAWTYGYSQNWPGPGSSAVPNPNFIGESGNPGVLAAIQSTPFSTGYLEGAWARSANPAVAQAWLGNGRKVHKKPVFSDPTVAANVLATFASLSASSIAQGMGSDGLPLATSRPECILYLSPGEWTGAILGHKTAVHAYPIVAVSYLLFYGNNNLVHYPQKKALIKFITGNKAQTIISGLEYAPLSSSILKADYQAALGSNSGKGPCVAP
jgi:phosphate transport system substrate-binding protein